MSTRELTRIACGIHLIEKSPHGGIYAITRVAQQQWAIIEIPAGELLQFNPDRPEHIPPLTRAKIVLLARTKQQCLKDFEDERGLLTREAVLAMLESKEGEGAE